MQVTKAYYKKVVILKQSSEHVVISRQPKTESLEAHAYEVWQRTRCHVKSLEEQLTQVIRYI